MRRRMKTIDLIVPKFLVECTYDIRTLLRKTGISQIFKDDVSALSSMSPESGLKITEGVHRCAIRKFHLIKREASISLGKLVGNCFLKRSFVSILTEKIFVKMPSVLFG